MSHYFHTELAHAVGPDFPKWLDRRWRYPPTPAISKIERDKLMRHALRVYGPRCHWCGRETLRPHQDHGRGQPHHRTLEHLKARGMGLSIPLDSFSFGFPSETTVCLAVDASQNDHAERWRFWQLKLPGNYLMAVCAERVAGQASALNLRRMKTLDAFEDMAPQIKKASAP